MSALFTGCTPLKFPALKSYVRDFYVSCLSKSSQNIAYCRAESLINAIKKQYGLHSYLLPLTLPTSPPPHPVPVPAPVRRLPPISSMVNSPMPPTQTPNSLPVTTPSPNSGEEPEQSQSQPEDGSTLLLAESDIQQIGRFVREFTTMSLLPWMEKCVIDWNEIVSEDKEYLPERRLITPAYHV